MIWVLVGVVLVLLAVIGVLVMRQRRSLQLKEGFGPEYDRVVAARGDQRAGEKELLERRKRHDHLEICPLDPAARDEYLERWAVTQRRFVDQPAAAVEQANVLVQQVMSERGYPVDGDFEQVAADVSVEHSEVVENYRAAHSTAVRAGGGQASTEELRQSMVHFRALLDDLLADDESDSARKDQARSGEIAQESTTRR
ncbi:MAG: hypothetical protein M3018_11565 [Actinomycetota bacterium]|nr:hypothetical protein [Actinomycetota bacterium]